MRTGYTKGQLEGDWAVFAKIASFFLHNVPPDDREDFLQDLMVEMAKVKAKYEAKGKTLTEAGLMRVASYELKGYWDKRRYRLFGLNCTHCTSEQRQECHTMRLPSECPKGKARRLLSLDKPVKNNDGDKLTELRNLIAYKAIDLDAKLDARNVLKCLPKRLVQIGYKTYAGVPLEKEEEKYLEHWQRTHHAPFVLKRDNLDELILERLRKKPQGLTRADLSMRLQVPVYILNLYLNRLIRRQQIIAVSRESTHGRPTPLLLIAGAEIPEQKKVKEERDERIRQAYFIEGWSIKRIHREMHHDNRTIRRAIYGIKIERR